MTTPLSDAIRTRIKYQSIRQKIDMRIMTATIGCLDQFERNFGYLWGHGLDELQLTEDQLQFRMIWDECRKQCLHNGNNNRRLCLAEFDKRYGPEASNAPEA